MIFEAIKINFWAYFWNIPIILAIFLFSLAVFASRIPFIAYVFHFFDSLPVYFQIPVLSALGIIFWFFVIKIFMDRIFEQQKQQEDTEEEKLKDLEVGAGAFLAAGRQARSMPQ